MTNIPDEQKPHAGNKETRHEMKQTGAEMNTVHRQNVALLIHLLKSPYQLDREKASDYLGETGDPQAVPALIEALGDPTISWLAAESLGKIGDERAVEPLIAVLGSDEKWLRRNAAEALGKLRAPSAVEPVIRLLSDKKHDVREIAARALGQIGDERAVPALRGLENDPDSRVREAALVSVTMINRNKTVG
ncbi:MAG: HEAT repeat domain-containing protein [Methanoregulaceae archaeon]|jgi:HEAT repeat protein|nr:HEAT repeat domain-containing protein [Methanoregulaceae archaeon]